MNRYDLRFEFQHGLLGSGHDRVLSRQDIIDAVAKLRDKYGSNPENILTKDWRALFEDVTEIATGVRGTHTSNSVWGTDSNKEVKNGPLDVQPESSIVGPAGTDEKDFEIEVEEIFATEAYAGTKHKFSASNVDNYR